MSNWKEQFLEWLELPRNRSRLIASVIGLFVLVGAVFFSTQIGNLFSLFGSRAGISPDDLTTQWQEVVDSGGEARLHGKLHTVDGGKWLYAMGGMDKKHSLVTGNDEVVMLNTVERIAIDAGTGKILEDALWEPVVSMNFGHAEFSVVQFDQFIYVIGGDIHVPPDNKEGHYPLLYSTIERLDPTADFPAWEVTALLSGVNFYPEVEVVDDEIHVIGGIYGDPFPPLPGMNAEDQRLDILNNGGANWTDLDLANKPVFGTTGIYVPIGHENTKITEGSPISGPLAFNVNAKALATQSNPDVAVASNNNKSLSFVATAYDQTLPSVVIPNEGDEFYLGERLTFTWDNLLGTNNSRGHEGQSIWYQNKNEDEWNFLAINMPSYPNGWIKTVI